MRLFPTPKAFSVSDWLELATNKLAATARKRIGLEVEGHYAEAVRAHVEEGMSEWDAEAAALAELGDAWAAARRFRKQHLTEWEAKNAESMVKNARDVYILALSYLVFLFLPYLMSHGLDYKMSRHSVRDLGLLLLVWVVLPTVSFVLARRKNANRNLSLLILIQSISGFYIGPTLILVTLFQQQSPAFWGNIYPLIFLVSVLYTRFINWQRLRKIGYFRDATTPRDAAIS